MKWCAARVEIDSPHPQDAIDRVSDIFVEMGLSGVVIDDPGLEPEEGWGEGAIERPDRYAVTGYFPCIDNLAGRQKTLEGSLARNLVDPACVYRVVYVPVEEENWAEAWKTYFQPIPVSERFVVKPTWRDYEPKSGEIVLEIDPGMAFGTGMHPTTMLCIQALEKTVKPGMALVDVGTGSGILSLAASRLGASPLIAIDRDRVAADIARRNLALNGVVESRYMTVAGALIESIRMQADIVVANILTEVILELLQTVREIIRPGGFFVCSGIISPQAEMIAEALRKQRFGGIGQTSLDGWVCFSAQALL